MTNRLWLLLVVLVLFVAGCTNEGSNVATATSTTVPTLTITSTATDTPTATQTITLSPTVPPTATPTLLPDETETVLAFLDEVNNKRAACRYVSEDDVPRELNSDERLLSFPVLHVSVGEICNVLEIVKLPENYVERGFPPTTSVLIYKYKPIVDGEVQPEEITVVKDVSVSSYWLEQFHIGYFSKE